MAEPLIVTIDDVRQASHCVKGARTWFNAHQIPFRDFVRNGVPADVMLGTGDALAVKIVDIAKARAGHG